MDLKKLKEIDYQGIAIQHCEKAAIVLVGCTLVLFVLSAWKNYRASSEITPQYIKQLAEKINNSVNNSQFDAKRQEIENPDLRGALAKLLGEQIDLKKYSWVQWYWKFVDFGGIYRDQPEILKPYNLLTKSDRGAAKLYATNDRGEIIKEIPQPSKPKPQKAKAEDPKTPKKGAPPGKGVAKGPPSKGMMGGRAGMGMGGAGGPAGGMGMGDMGGMAAMTGGGGAGGQAAGEGGIMMGAAAGRGGRGFGAGDSGGENLRTSIAQKNTGNIRRPSKEWELSGMGDKGDQKPEPGDKPADKAKTGKEPVPKEVYRGVRVVVVTALFPHAEQVKKFKEALHEDEMPDYLGSFVERRYLQRDGTFSAWAGVDINQMKKKVIDLLPERWDEEHPDLLAAKALLPDLVMKVPYLKDRKSTRLNSSHSRASRMPSSA